MASASLKPEILQRFKQVRKQEKINRLAASTIYFFFVQQVLEKIMMAPFRKWCHFYAQKR